MKPGMASLLVTIAMRRNGLVWAAVVTHGARAGTVQARTVQFVALGARR